MYKCDEKSVHAWMPYLLGKLRWCSKNVLFTRGGCNEKVSYGDEKILTKMIRGLKCCKFLQNMFQKGEKVRHDQVILQL